MSIEFAELNKGPVVVIDDEIGKKGDIDRIISKIEEKGLPVLKYPDVEKAENEITNICFSSFIILDWYLYPNEVPTEEGVSIGEELKIALNEKKINFIKKLKDVCFSPIFIFTNISEEDIEKEIKGPLKKSGLLYSDCRKNFIFTKNKQEILKGLFKDIDKWISENPHIYLSKFWLNQIIKNSNEIFWTLYGKNSDWPNIFYKSFDKDGEDPIGGLNDILFRLVKAKMNLNKIDNKIFKRDVKEVNNNEIKKLYASIMYLREGIKNDIKPGDIFKDGKKYYINIRPECDTTNRKNRENIDDTIVYLIEGRKVSDKKIHDEFYEEKYGLLNRPTFHILPFLDEKNFIKFYFKELHIKIYLEIRDKKICRLLPPFVTQFQQRFTSFLGRYGIPKVPQEVYNEIFNNVGDSKNA